MKATLPDAEMPVPAAIDELPPDAETELLPASADLPAGEDPQTLRRATGSVDIVDITELMQARTQQLGVIHNPPI